MGAEYFETTWAGKEASEAFRFCTEEARHMEGHGGYTGTIAEKGSFKLFHLPARVSFRKLMQWVWLHQDLELAKAAVQDAARYEATTLAVKQARSRLRKVEAKFGRIPAEHRALVRNVFDVVDDKWGPAAAFELAGKAAKDFKARNNLKGTRKRVYIFCGHASS